MSEMDNEKQNIEIWKIKNLIKTLSKVKGNGTSMVSLIIPTRSQISLTNKMLTEEFGTASNIKSRTNRLSVLSAITSAQQKLKLYSRTPKNGLVILCGTAITESGKEKKLNIDFEPFKPINKSLYLCDNKFHLEPLRELLDDDEVYGFIIVDGNGTLLASVSNNVKKILYSFSVDLPKKHGRGGQSALRFARLRMEARHNYQKKINEHIRKYFTKDNKPTVNGLVIAGSANLKVKVVENDSFPNVLKPLIRASLDISYGGTNGLNQAIELSASILSDVKLVKEKNIISNYFTHISKSTGMCSYGIKNTLYALELGAVEELIIWEDYPIIRYELFNNLTKEDKIINIYPDKVTPQTFMDKDNVTLDIKSEMLFIEWIMQKYSEFGIKKLSIVSDKTQEGHQFCRGFGGLGGLLRWEVDFTYDLDEDEENFM